MPDKSTEERQSMAWLLGGKGRQMQACELAGTECVSKRQHVRPVYKESIAPHF